MKIKTSQEAVQLINEKTNLSLKLHENQTFAKIKTKAGRRFFSVRLETQSSESVIFRQLQDFASNCSFIKEIVSGGANMATIILKEYEERQQGQEWGEGGTSEEGRVESVK